MDFLSGAVGCNFLEGGGGLIEYSMVFSPLPGRYSIDRFKDFDKSAFIAELQSLRDLCNRDVNIRK